MPYSGVHRSLWKWIVSGGAILLLVAAILGLGFASNPGVDFNATAAFLVAAAAFALAGLVTITYGLRFRGPGEGGFPMWSEMSGRRQGVTLAVLGLLPLLLGTYTLWLACYPPGFVSCPAGGCTGPYYLCNPSASFFGIALGALGADMIGLGLMLIWWNRARFVRTRSYRIKTARTR